MHKQQAPLLLMPKASTRLKQANIAAHILAATAVIGNSLPVVVQGFLLAACALSFHLNLNRLKSIPAKIKHNDVSGWEISCNGDEFESVQILPSTVITTLVVLIHYQVGGLTTKQMRTLLVINDALDQKDYRSLVVRLKTSRGR